MLYIYEVHLHLYICSLIKKRFRMQLRWTREALNGREEQWFRKDACRIESPVKMP